MIVRPGEPLHVSLAFGPDDEVRLGRLALDRRFVAAFEYDPSALARGLRVQPMWPPPAPGIVFAKQPRVFEGLHGIFADSLPDAWGRAVLQRRARREGVAYEQLSVLDRLAMVGSTGPGALAYRPDRSERDDERVDLDRLAEGALAVLEGRDTDALEELAKLGGSSGGARPKVLVARNADGQLIAGNAEIPGGYEAWIVKFRSRHDVEDIGPLEAAYADMARAAGLAVAPTTLLPAHRGPGYFATKRFDRGPGQSRQHILSAAAILDADWAIPSIDASALHRLVRQVTRNQVDVAAMFRRTVFNVAAHNRDDHLKQHAFLMARDGAWSLAPAFDLTFSGGPGGEHYLAVNGRGTAIGTEDLLALARDADVRPRRARAIIDEVLAAAARFRDFASTYDVSAATLASVETGLRATTAALS